MFLADCRDTSCSADLPPQSTATLIFLAGAVVHLYSTSLYYGSELVAGLPNVDTDSVVGLFIKFGLANSPWLVMPVLVLVWGSARLEGYRGA